MPVDHIRYDLLVQDALRSVIRTVLTDVAAAGLPGDHHFYITFDTRVDGVRLSARLRASYPEEMTIVLQQQFWELSVGEDGFDVVLAFGGIPERLHISFGALTAFVDPSVQFGLQFAPDNDAPADAAATGPEPAPAAVPPSRNGPTAEESAPEPAREDGSGEVVRLDRFRKK
jgi:uncharacterized protein